MDTTMELDDLKSAWATLDARLARSDALNLRLLRDRSLDTTRGRLRPLFWGQLAQIAFGLALVAIAVAFWTQHRDAPVPLAMGIALQVVGVVTMIAGGVTLGALSRIDYAAPVIAIQAQLLRVRRAYVIGGMVAGLSWWLAWMPFTTAAFGLLGMDVSQLTWAHYLPGIALGLAGLATTWAFDRWSRQPRRERLRRAMETRITGASLRKAQAQLEEIEAFESEAGRSPPRW